MWHSVHCYRDNALDLQASSKTPLTYEQAQAFAQQRHDEGYEPIFIVESDPPPGEPPVRHEGGIRLVEAWRPK